MIGLSKPGDSVPVKKGPCSHSATALVPVDETCVTSQSVCSAC